MKQVSNPTPLTKEQNTMPIIPEWLKLPMDAREKLKKHIFSHIHHAKLEQREKDISGAKELSKDILDQAIKQERSRVVDGMRVRITFTEDSPFKGATEILENITEIHYCYDTPMNEPRTAFESDIDSTGITYENRYIKEFESLKEL